MIDRKMLFEGIEDLGLSCTERETELMDLYCEALIEKNKYLNLTRVTDPLSVITEHLLDSLAVLKYCDMNHKKILDIGTGAGFPGVPLAIMLPKSRVTLMDSTGKKISFIEETCKDLGIDNADFKIGRAEDFAHGDMREKYDIAVARAVSKMSVISELALPFVKKGGVFAAYKSQNSEDEINEAFDIVKNLGGKLCIKKITIPISGRERLFGFAEKIRETPKNYPRPYNRIIGKSK